MNPTHTFWELIRGKFLQLGLPCIFTAMLAMSSSLRAADLPSPEKGGVEGAPINLLVISQEHKKRPAIDPAYAEELKEAGYNLHVVNREDRLSLDYLKQFGAVVLTNLPYSGEEYTVFGFKLRHVEETMQLLHQYVREGGGLVVMPAMHEFGEAYGAVYDRFLKPWDLSFLIHQLKEGGELKNVREGGYGTGTITGKHTIASTLSGKKVLYPTNVMRWDHSYSCTPLLPGKGWEVLATADNPTTHIAITNSEVGKELTKQNNLYAVREDGKGRVAVSAIHSFYTLTNVSSKVTSIGEQGTGVIDFKVMRGEQDGRSSVFGQLLDRTFRVFSANSARHGIGKWRDLPLPEASPLATSDPLIDWSTRQPPTTWAHRVIPGQGWPKPYDELPDPNIQGEMKYWKILVGPRTAYSSGKGTVREYRDAAIKAGYSAIAFAETFEDLTLQEWKTFVKDCQDNSDADFICLPGIDILGTEGQRYLVLGIERFPEKHWLSEDGKKLAAIRMLSLGWFGHISVVARPSQSPLHYKTFKHYFGISVATYDTKGEQVDDGFQAYQWSVASDSQPIPMAVHEVTSPSDVKNATKGYQQIMPAPTLSKAVHYFRHAFTHCFDAPLRYFISEGPLVDGWSMFNKDKGKAEFNRTKFRMAVGARSEDGKTPISEIQLYDGFDVVRHWRNDAPSFQTTVDGTHNKQHAFMLLAKDRKGRRALTTALRTVCSNYRARCGDKQNWLGSQIVYTGWWLNGLPGYNLQLANESPEGNGRHAPAILDLPFFSDHVQVNDADLGWHFTQGERQDIAGDAKGMLPLAPNEFVDGKVRYTYFSTLKQDDFAVLMVETDITLKKETEVNSGLNPWIGTDHTLRWNNKLILPNLETDELGAVAGRFKKTDKGKEIPDRIGNEANMALNLPVGTYAGGVIPLTPGLRIEKRQLGFAAKGGVLPAGTKWSARFLMLRDRKYRWTTNRKRHFNREIVDQHAEQALTEMGFRGKLPYELRLTQGKLEKTAYIAHLKAEDGGIAGKNINKSGKPMLMNVPMQIQGLDEDSEMVLWRSDSPYLEPFAAWQSQGYLSFNADKEVDFYAGNIARCDSRLAVSMVSWTKDQAHFRAHNPTEKSITTDFVTPAAIKGYHPVKTKLTVPAGTSIEVK